MNLIFRGNLYLNKKTLIDEKLIQDMETKDLSGIVVHEGERFYQCGSCDQKFTSKYNMQRHVKNVHGQKKSKHKKGEKSVTIEEYDFCDKNENIGGGGGNGEPSLKIKLVIRLSY